MQSTDAWHGLKAHVTHLSSERLPNWELGVTREHDSTDCGPSTNRRQTESSARLDGLGEQNKWPYKLCVLLGKTSMLEKFQFHAHQCQQSMMAMNYIFTIWGASEWVHTDTWATGYAPSILVWTTLERGSFHLPRDGEAAYCFSRAHPASFCVLLRRRQTTELQINWLRAFHHEAVNKRTTHSAHKMLKSCREEPLPPLFPCVAQQRDPAQATPQRTRLAMIYFSNEKWMKRLRH